MGDFSLYRSEPLRDFIRERNARGLTIFAAGLEEALKRPAQD